VETNTCEMCSFHIRENTDLLLLVYNVAQLRLHPEEANVIFLRNAANNVTNNSSNKNDKCLLEFAACIKIQEFYRHLHMKEGVSSL